MLTMKATRRLGAGSVAALAAPFALAHHHEPEVVAEQATLLTPLGYATAAIVLVLAALLFAARRFRQRPGGQPVLENRE